MPIAMEFVVMIGSVRTLQYVLAVTFLVSVALHGTETASKRSVTLVTNTVSDYFRQILDVRT
jgi:hypothetical protein